MSKTAGGNPIINGITKDLKAIPKKLKSKISGADTKKLILLNLPYILAGYFVDKVAWLWRICEGNNASDKLMAVMGQMEKLFSNPLPSFHPKDLIIGVSGGIILRLVVYFKAKNAKKFRQGVEYGSARWGNAKDIEPYVDEVFENNVILTQTERLMMLLSVKLDAPVPCRLDTPDLGLTCRASADCLHQHLQVI